MTDDVNAVSHSLDATNNPLTAFAIEAAYGPRNQDATLPGQADSHSVGGISASEFISTSLRLFDRLDRDHDGHLTRAEIAKAVEDPSIKGKDAKVLAALYHAQIPMWQAAVPGGRTNSNYAAWRGYKLSKTDIQHFSWIEEEHLKHVAALKSALTDQNFVDNIDSDHNGKFSVQELKAAEKNPLFSPDQQKIVQFLAKHPNILQNARTKLTDFVLAFDQNGEERVWGAVHGALERADYYGREASTKLYADDKDPLKSIRPEAVRQGYAGDCYFLAAVAEVARNNPSAIKEMITDNKNGTYTVTFPGNKAEPVTVAEPTEAEQYLYNGMSPYGKWASVLEKGYGQYCRDHFWHRFQTNPSGGYTTTEGADGGGWWRGLELLTGKPVVEEDLGKTPAATVAKHLQEALSEKPPRIVIVASQLFRADTDFFPAHMYSVEKFDPSGPDGGTVTVRNPHGNPRSDIFGNLTWDISLNQYRQYFFKQAIAGR